MYFVWCFKKRIIKTDKLKLFLINHDMDYTVEELNLSYQNLTQLPDLSLYKKLKQLNCNYNQLTSLQGCPNSVVELYCWNNQLTSLQGCSNSVVELDCSYNRLTSLQGCPNSVVELYCSNNQLKSKYQNKTTEEL